MSKQSITLSSAGLKNIVMNIEEEFVFKFGEKEMKMNKIFAEFISPRVTHIHQCDPTINFIDLSESSNDIKITKKVNKIFEELFNDNFFSEIKNLSEGNSIEIKNENLLRSIKYFSILVNNEELFNKIDEINTANEKEDKNIDKLLEELEFLYEMNPTFNEHCYSKLIDEISSKISKNDVKFLKEIPKSTLYLILSSEHLKLEDNDSLFDIINEIFSKEDEEEDEYNITSFYELIDIKQLSKNKYEAFISKLDYRKLTFNLWEKLCKIFINQKENEVTSNFQVKEIKFDGQTNHRFNGIINHLQGSEKNNICDRGIINVTSSTNQINHLPKYAVDFNNVNYFRSDNDNEGRDWLKYDFKEMKICPTHYSIKTRNNDNYCNPVNWVIEVSNTDKDDDWRVIDSRTDVTSVSKKNQSDTFDISTSLSNREYYRYIRFRATGKTSGECNNIAISSLEYFGYLIE